MRPSTRIILESVGEAFEVTADDLLKPCRSLTLAYARCCAYTLLRTLCPSMSYPEIGREMQRDHSTVLVGHRRHMWRVANDLDVRRKHLLAQRLASDRLDVAEAELRDKCGSGPRVRVAVAP